MSIPIILHLINLRKYKTVYFSNVNLLREIKEESRKSRKIKNWLILLFRVLFITFLVFAFAFPYSGIKSNNDDQTISIYLDNSFSMDNEGVEGNKLNNGKAFADQIVQQAPSNTKFHIVTNDFKGKHQIKISKREAQEEISKITTSHISRSLQSILNRQSLFLQGNDNKNNHLFWISDFQQLEINKISNPDSFKINLALLKSIEKLNLSLDSIWFESPVRKKIGSEILKFQISNYASESIKNQIINLTINNRINSFTISELKPGQSTFDFRFQIPEDSLIKGVLSLEDQSLLFDNELLFSYLIPNKQKVCLIANKDSEIIPTIRKIFQGDSSVQLSILTPFEIDFKSLGEQDLILLGELDKISQNLAIELLKMTKKGKITTIIPGNNSDIANYNNAFKLWGDVSLGEKKKSNINIGDIQKSHSFFDDVFEKKKIRNNLKEAFPLLYIHYDFLSVSNTETIILKEDDSPFLLTHNNFYYLASGLSPKQSNFSKNAFIIPLLYQMLFKSISTTPIQYFISPKTELIAPSSSDRNVTVKSKNIVNQLRVNNYKSLIPSDFRKGYYELINSNEIKGAFALNYNRTENLVINEQLKRLNKIRESPLVSSFEVFGNQSSNLEKLSQSKNSHWFFCMIISLISLFVEMFLIRIKI